MKGPFLLRSFHFVKTIIAINNDSEVPYLWWRTNKVKRYHYANK